MHQWDRCRLDPQRSALCENQTNLTNWRNEHRGSSRNWSTDSHRVFLCVWPHEPLPTSVLKHKQLQKLRGAALCKNEALAVDRSTLYLQGWTRCVNISYFLYFSKEGSKVPCKEESLFKSFIILRRRSSRTLKFVYLFQIYNRGSNKRYYCLCGKFLFPLNIRASQLNQKSN